jgi:hypothetical protein
MTFEKRWASIAPRPFIGNGGANGRIELSDTALFKVKQKVVVTADGENNLEVEVKAVVSKNVLYVGKYGNINARTDLSAYTLSKNAAILADEQPRTAIPFEERDRAIFDEEPVNADRVIPVDQYGMYHTETNPFPTFDIGARWDHILLTRDGDGDIVKAVYEYQGEVVRILDLFYDLDKDLVEVIKS